MVKESNKTTSWKRGWISPHAKAGFAASHGWRPAGSTRGLLKTPWSGFRCDPPGHPPSIHDMYVWIYVLSRDRIIYSVRIYTICMCIYIYICIYIQNTCVHLHIYICNIDNIHLTYTPTIWWWWWMVINDPLIIINHHQSPYPSPWPSMLMDPSLQQIQTVGQQGLHHGEMAMSCRPHAGGPRNVAGRYGPGPHRSFGGSWEILRWEYN